MISGKYLNGAAQPILHEYTMQSNKWLSLLSALVLLFMAGCVPSPEIRGITTTSDPLVEQAEALAAAGDYVAAAELFEQSASSKESPEKERLLLRAAETRFLAADPDGATRILALIDVSNQPQLDFQKRLLVAEMAISRNRPEEALELLATPPGEGIDADLQRRYLSDRAEAFRLSGNLLESGHELALLDQLLVDHSMKLDNQLLILQTYAGMTDEALMLLQPIPPGDQGGWMELTRIVKAHANDEAQINELFAAWRTQFPSHPAMPELLDGYFRKLKGQYRRADQLAVLLPQSGPYARVASSLKDGLLTAYYQDNPEQRPQLLFYDTSNPEDLWPVYQQAVAAGAEMIIGPLDKQNVAQLARSGTLEVPVLALNQVPPEGILPADLYQFSLSPEDEARQVADRAWTDGHTNAVALVPDNSWGTRVLDAFRQRWEQLGGTLAEYQRYNVEEHDFAKPIKTLLNLDQSENRRSQLERLFGQRLEFEPQRRQDASFVFLAAKSQLARQIRPQLQYHHAADLPVYTTSHVYTGIESPDADQDLEGIKFPIVPWIAINSEDDPLSLGALLAVFPDADPRHYPIYAMGIDSYLLLPHLARLQNSPREVLEGKTGNLYMDPLRQVHRQMVWAEMLDGVPKVIGFTPILETGYSAFPETPVNQPEALPDLPPADPVPGDESKANQIEG